VACERVADRYGQFMEEAANLHTLLDAGQHILGQGVTPGVELIPFRGVRAALWAKPQGASFRS
jgi:hypothetical protein